MVRAPWRERAIDKPYIDYSRSIILTADDYINMLEQKAERKAAPTLERERRRVEAEENKRKREFEKVKAALAKTCEEEKLAKRAFDALWSAKHVERPVTNFMS